MIQFFEDESASRRCSNSICVSEDHIPREALNTFPKSPIIFRSRKPSESWLSAVNKVRIGVRVMRGFQFYTSRSLAKAVGDGRSVKEQNSRAARQLGHFPSILRRICKRIRVEDQCFMVVELTTPNPEKMLHYLVMVRHRNEDGTKEDMIMGTEVSIEAGEVSRVTFVFSVPLLSNVRVQLHGENRFLVTSPHDSYLLKPSTIQSQWAALTFLTDSIRRAQDFNMYVEGTTHKWCSHYSSQQGQPLDPYWRHKHRSDEQQQATTLLDIFGSRKRRKHSPPAGLITGDEDIFSEQGLRTISKEIRRVMHTMDIDEATVPDIRSAVEVNLKLDLKPIRRWVNEQILLIYGQMDEPSLILEYLYLGTEWNACNLDELLDNGVTHVLNCSNDIDNFFEKRFKYLRVPVRDVPEANLIKHWQDTYDFVKDCKQRGSKVLVHCQMGVSRSSSTVISYLMREYGRSYSEARQFTKAKRDCVNPNPGFSKQLELYGDILRRDQHDKDTDLSEIFKSVTLS